VGHLAGPAASGDHSCVESPLDRDDVTAILTGSFNANSKLDEIIYFLGIDDEEEEPPDT
jgi:hypothetical protein